MRFSAPFNLNIQGSGFSSTIGTNITVPLTGINPALRGAAGCQLAVILGTPPRTTEEPPNGSYTLSLSAQISVYGSNNTQKGVFNYNGEYTLVVSGGGPPNFNLPTLSFGVITNQWTPTSGTVFRDFSASDVGSAPSLDALLVPSDPALNKTVSNLTRYKIQIWAVSPVYLFMVNPTDYYVLESLSFSSTLSFPMPPVVRTATMRRCDLPLPSFTVTTGEDVLFNGSASSIFSDLSNSIVDYYWDFGDGANQHTATPTTTHAYDDDLTRTAKLVTTDSHGSFDTTTRSATGISVTRSDAFSDPHSVMYGAINSGNNIQLYRFPDGISTRETAYLLTGHKDPSIWQTEGTNDIYLLAQDRTAPNAWKVFVSDDSGESFTFMANTPFDSTYKVVGRNSDNGAIYAAYKGTDAYFAIADNEGNFDAFTGGIGTGAKIKLVGALGTSPKPLSVYQEEGSSRIVVTNSSDKKWTSDDFGVTWDVA